MEYKIDPTNPIYGYLGIIILIIFFIWRKKHKINKEAKHKLAVEKRMQELKENENKKRLF